MRKRLSQKPHTVGLEPGSLVYSGQRGQQPVTLTIIEYGAELPVLERHAQTVAECFPFNEKASVTWIDVDGIQQVNMIEEIGDYLSIHPLVLEDILNTNQRPKMEDFEDYLFIELNMLHWDAGKSLVESEQVSLILGANYVITIQEQERDIFDSIRVRLREGKGRITKRGADYLAYSLLDAIVDHYFIILENLGEQIEFLEEELITEPDSETLQTIHQLKREMVFLRKSVWPLREVIGALERGESSLFLESSMVYLRDIYDHTIQIIDTIETFRDIISGVLDIYLSSVSNRMNEVMKVLTIIATIFIPLSFIVGVYGMNFVYMPELQWRWGYFAVWAILIAVAGTMLLYFRKKKWF